MHTPTEQQVLDVFAGMDREVRSVDEDLFDAGHLDSMAFVELLARIESACGVTFEIEALELDSFRTVRAIAAWIDSGRTAGLSAGTSSARTG